ncbi:hypothetical protein RSAG8_11358, partial [Rhizoctonia solani AG-8 WAC10335]
MFRWAYYVTFEELVDLHKKRGGKLGTFTPKNTEDIEHARRAIFKYLLPGPVRVWYATLDDQLGVVFFVGKPVREPRAAFERILASRCYKMFGRSPDPCNSVTNSDNMWWDLSSRDGSKYRLELWEFLGSDSDGDMYPLSPLEIAALPRATSSSQSAI